MGKKKGRKDGMSTAEYNKYVKSYQTPCPKESCDGTACYSDLGWGKFFQCHKCGKTFGYQDGRGSSISKQAYDALATRAKSRPAKGAGMSCPAEEAGMAKVTKKGAKAKKKSSKKKAVKKGAGVGGLVVKMLTANPNISNDEVLAAVKKEFPEASTSNSNISWYRWKNGIPAPKKEKSAPKPKAVAKPKATLKKKAKAKKKTAKK